MKKQRILIGLHGLSHTPTRATAETLAKSLDLAAVRISKVVQMACAGALNMNFYDFEAHSPDHRFPEIAMTKCEFMCFMKKMLNSLNPNHALNMIFREFRNPNSMHKHLFSGEIFMEITTESEAEWIRQQGGTIIHLHQESTEDRHPLSCETALKPKEDVDFVITNNSTQDELLSKLRDMGLELRHRPAA
ncbi:hypothetical protein HBA55_35000 [Pseudomaricurvus alkylphenolicus]|uniref:hypothetical protein n=1 Tax=Pseudomaricurvus alkylphenolicus TaxID=1306991 RepID=UPI001420D34F|nr:hypothetical protein [Pseudomaricurvus alkylphenolicus]NIB44842.1 hypothetical protein [Pseudomaricurvus alkylphenolicus]